jgi:cytochrome c oxidase subunit 2
MGGMRVGWRLGFRGAACDVGAALAAVAVALVAAPAALAEEPVDWQLGFQAAASPVRERIDQLNDLLLVIITAIALFVLGLLLFVIVKFSAKRHPVPTQTTHNTLLEVIWFAVPCLILLGIAIPSFKLLYYVDRTQNADMTIKVTGDQWFWNYEYPDYKGLAFDSSMVDEKNLQKGQPRLLEVDEPLVVPVGAKIRILVTSRNVIHSWFVPAVGVQTYAVLGRTNETWMQLDRPGTYYGQCNQICGKNHEMMPIEIKAVAKPDFDKWVANPKMKFAANGEPIEPRLAADAAR